MGGEGLVLYKGPKKKKITDCEPLKSELPYLGLFKDPGNLLNPSNSLCTEMDSVSGQRSPQNDVSGLPTLAHARLCRLMPSPKPETHNPRGSVLYAATQGHREASGTQKKP